MGVNYGIPKISQWFCYAIHVMQYMPPNEQLQMGNSKQSPGMVHTSRQPHWHEAFSEL